MEEDNRSYHLPHPFRQYQYRRISKPNVTVTSTVTAATPSVDDAVSSSLLQLQRGGSVSTKEEPIPIIRWGGERSGSGISLSNRVVPSLFRTTNDTALKTITTEDAKNNTTTGDQKRSILGMTPMEDDDDDKTNSKYNNDRSNGCVHQDVPIQQESPYTWVEETQRLFQDYQHRFHRQSLTEQAKELLDRAIVLAKDGGNVNNIDSDINSNNNINNNINSNSINNNSINNNNNNNNIYASIALCTEALELCRNAIKDQEGALNRTDNVIGGSYLVTGDIRLRRKGEALEAKIHCLRAAVHYKEGLYHESLDDCEAAIVIWEQQRETTKGIVARNRGRTVVPAAAAVTTMGHHIGTKPLATNHESPLSSQLRTTRTTTTTIPPSRARKLSHKHLYLLKGRVLAAMGRYRDAVVWLTHFRQLPARTFRRSSALLETDAAMNKFLDQLSIRSGCGGGQTKRGAIRIPKEKHNSCTTPPRAALKAPPIMSDSTSTSTSTAMIPANTKVWSNLLHSVDKRLNEGMAGKFHANYNSSSSSRNRSNSGSAIYQMLRHGPFLFHHYQHQVNDEKNEVLTHSHHSNRFEATKTNAS
jgi:tetratricopeptide (TPR) repeat protein